MKNYTLLLLVGLGAGFSSSVMAENGPERQAKEEGGFDQFLDSETVFNGKFSTWVELSTDYVFRGESETNDGSIPSLKAALTWTHDSGAYAGLYVANNLFPGSDSEGHNPKINAIYGPYIGYAAEIGDTGFNYNGFLFQYLYPGDSDSNYLENFNYIDKQFGKVNIKFEYSPTLTDWFGVKDLQSHNIAIHPSIALAHGFTVSGSIGRQFFSDNGKSGALDLDGNGKTELDWTHWNLGVSRNVFGYNVDLRYHDTDIKIGDNDFYGYSSNNQIVDARFVASISKSF